MGNVSTNEHRQNKQRHHIPDIKFYHGKQQKGGKQRGKDETKPESRDGRKKIMTAENIARKE